MRVILTRQAISAPFNTNLLLLGCIFGVFKWFALFVFASKRVNANSLQKKLKSSRNAVFVNKTLGWYFWNSCHARLKAAGVIGFVLTAVQTQTSVVLIRAGHPTKIIVALQDSGHPHKHHEQSGSRTLLLWYPVKRGRAPDMKWNHITVHPHVSWP